MPFNLLDMRVDKFFSWVFESKHFSLIALKKKNDLSTREIQVAPAPGIFFSKIRARPICLDKCVVE